MNAILIYRMGLYELLALHPDDKVRKAAQKMKRLDEKLKLIMQREKEVCVYIFLHKFNTVVESV